MKYALVFILSILEIDAFSQSIKLPTDSVIVRNRIKTITSYFNDESTKDELSELWEFNLDGKLISKQLFDNEDTTLCADLYFYKDNLLMEYWRIGAFLKYDTVKTIYTYDSKDRVLNEVTTGKFSLFDSKANGFENSIIYTYVNDTVTLKKYEGIGGTYRCSGLDSIVYNSDKTLKYLSNTTLDLKISYNYNEQKQLIYETQTSILYPDLIYRFNQYFYEEGQLVKEIMGNSMTGDGKNISEQEYFFARNEKGLVTKTLRPLSFELYKYDYYK
jgi:hypothetical protein